MIEVRDLRVSYDGAVAVDGVSIDIGVGEMVALVGPNGAGKTTLVRTLAGLKAASGGSVRVDGRVGVVSEGRQLFGDMSVDDNLRLGAWRVRNRDPRRIYDLLPDLAPRARQLAGTLSGGQQQMVAIGRALMSDPEILLVDELSWGLAPMIVDGLATFIRDLNRTRHVTVLLVEQNARLALTICERAYVLETGHVVADGPSSSLIEAGVLEDGYFHGGAS